MTVTRESTELQRMPLSRFAEALAAATPAPGGSCAAAVPGALAAGLIGMAARLTGQSDPFSDLDFDMGAVASEADRLRAELLDHVDADAFDRVMAARRLPSRTREQQASRSREVQRAYQAAVEPALQVCTLSLRVLELAAEVVERGNPHVVSEGGVAALFAAASVEAAVLNIEAELGPVDDEDFGSARMRDARAARRQSGLLLDSVLPAVQRRIAASSPPGRNSAPTVAVGGSAVMRE